MKSMIINRRTRDIWIPERLLQLLPYRLSNAVRDAEESLDGLCEEIRLRSNGLCSLTVSGGQTLPIDLTLTRDEMDEALGKICGGSLYAHGDTIKNGYVSLFGGIRAGVCGRAAIDNGRVIGISEISSICIRIPHAVHVDPSPVTDLLCESLYTGGVLIYSPPGEGKTTLLRSVAHELSKVRTDKNGLRVAVVDSRGELECGLHSGNILVDVLTGYPKSLGIEIALRTLNANIIVCDEIGNEEEARSILDVSVGGAALVASAHASDIRSLLAKRSIRLLHDHGVFGAYVGIRRQNGDFIYTITRRDEVDI